MLTFQIRRFFANLPKVTSFSQVKDLSASKLSGDDLTEALQKYKLSSWNYGTQVSHTEHVVDGQHTEESHETEQLNKTFHFNDCRHAFAFMDSLAPIIERLNHHPEWTQIDNEVDVRLNTHDAGNSVSIKDVILARTMDYVYDQIADKSVQFAVQEATLNADDVFQNAVSEDSLSRAEDRGRARLYEGRGRNDPELVTKKHKSSQKAVTKPADKSGDKSTSEHYKQVTNL